MASFSIPGLGFAKPNEDLPIPNDEPTSTAVGPAATETSKNTDPPKTEPIVANSADGAIPKDADVLMSEQPPQPTEEPINKQGQPESMDIEKPPTDIPTDSTPKSDDKAPQEAQVSSQSDAVPGSSEPMKVDEAPANGASITDDLEAAIGGLGPFTTAAATVEPQATTSDQHGQQPGEHPEWEADSSPYVSSSESSESESSSEDDSEDEQFAAMSLEEAARMLMEAEAGSDDEDRGDKSSRGQIRTKNELAEAPLPKPDVTLTPESRIEELGAVEHIVDTIIVIKAVTPGEYQVIDSGSVLCTGDRVVIGALADVIGKVQAPLYTVQFASAEEIKELGLEVGTKVFYSAEHANYVFTQAIKNIKGSDASNLHDEEVGDDEAEFSDDEKEAEHKRKLKQKRREKHGHGEGRGRGGRGPHPLRNETRNEGPSGALNYDDDGEDGPYKPLSRPPGYGAGGFSETTEEPPPGTHRHRGGRGGFNRGRGGQQRGRGSGRGRGGYAQGGGHRDGYSMPPQGNQYRQQQQQQQQPPPSLPGFGQQSGFNFQLPQMPPGQAQPGAAAPGLPVWNGMPANLPFPNAQVPPPPPPGWGGQQMPAGTPAAGNPAFSPQILGLLAQMMGQNRGQNQSQSQNQWPGQQQGPQGGYGSGS